MLHKLSGHYWDAEIFVIVFCVIHSLWTDPKKVDAWLLILLAVMAAPEVGQEDGDGEQEGAHRVQPEQDHHHYQALQHGELDYFRISTLGFFTNQFPPSPWESH